MIRLYSPQNEVELALIKSILEGEGIFYFVHNDHFGSLRVGPRIELLNKKTIMVRPEDAKRAKDLIADFLQTTKIKESVPDFGLSLWDKLRMLVEFLIFSWPVPGKKWRGRKNKR